MFNISFKVAILGRDEFMKMLLIRYVDDLHAHTRTRHPQRMPTQKYQRRHGEEEGGHYFEKVLL